MSTSKSSSAGFSSKLSRISEAITPSPIPTPSSHSAAGNSKHSHYLKRNGAFRNAVRNKLLPIVRWETPILGKIQSYVRHPFLDIYFTQSANLGSHTFYVLLLPIAFFFGFQEIGAVLVFLLASGVYLTNFLKDFCCLPRPLSPPLHRLTMSKDAALEYGFPSTHTANAISVSLFFADTLCKSKDAISPHTYYALHFLNALYIFSLVAGRIYCGMHGFLDIFGGAFIGFALYFWGASAYFKIFSHLLWSNTYWALLIIPIVLLLVRIHPEPADDCPCFEDSVAFLGVLAGQVVGDWQMTRIFAKAVTLRSTVNEHGFWDRVCLKTTDAYMLHWGAYKPGNLTAVNMLIRFAIGSILVGAWKTFSKKFFLAVLPPLWRRMEEIGVSMPRRFYVPASQYGDVPNDETPDKTLRLFPGLMEQNSASDSEKNNISTSLDKSTAGQDSAKSSFRNRMTKETVGPQSVAEVYEAIAYREHQLKKASSSSEETPENSDKGLTNGGADDAEEVPEELVAEIIVPRVHYDVEVVTKLLVYAGISVMVMDVSRIIFAILGV